ncbi:glycoside hydrolase superfamily [Syncephalis plumigaleata]|nr:glycoside hydrolase superfamily [Syncephalis plumigaleata]
MQKRYHQRVPSNADSMASDANWDARSTKETFHLTRRQFICWSAIIGATIIAAIAGLLVWAIVSRMQSGNHVAVPSNTNLTIVPSPDLVKSFYGLTYTPQRAQYPECGVSVGDVNLLEKAIGLLKINVTLILTIWVDKHQETYDRQLKALWDTLDKYKGKRIDGISVGNEALFRKDVTAEELARRMNDIRQEVKKRNLNIPVYTTDLAENFDNVIMQASDAALGNIHPYFAKTSVSDAAKWTWDYFDKTIAKSGKTAIISETGWPTQGDSTGSAVPSVANLQTYLDNFLCQTAAKNIPCYFFEAYDAAWKTNVEAVEKSWGLLTKDRKLKVRIPRCDGTTSSSSSSSSPSTPATTAGTANTVNTGTAGRVQAASPSTVAAPANVPVTRAGTQTTTT